MGPLGTQELVVIFILALLLFGPKKLPELGKTIGKAMADFRRAQSELKATFDREMNNLERETGVKDLVATKYKTEDYAYDYSSYDSSYDENYYSNVANNAHTDTTTDTTGASASLGAGSSPLQLEAAHGSIASGHLETAHESHAAAPSEAQAGGHSDSGHATGSTTGAAKPEEPVHS
jgi:sec-independent protein translocase protein TatA